MRVCYAFQLPQHRVQLLLDPKLLRPHFVISFLLDALCFPNEKLNESNLRVHRHALSLPGNRCFLFTHGPKRAHRDQGLRHRLEKPVPRVQADQLLHHVLDAHFPLRRVRSVLEETNQANYGWSFEKFETGRNHPRSNLEVEGLLERREKCYIYLDYLFCTPHMRYVSSMSTIDLCIAFELTNQVLR